MQKLALMMAVMILGMSPAHGCSIGADPRSLGVGGQAEMMPLLPTWFSDDGRTLMTKDTVNSAAAEGNQPVEPGEHLIGRILQQIQLGVGDLSRIGNGITRTGRDEAMEAPGGQKGQNYKPKGETALKAAEALRKGADAARGRGQRKSRLYQRTGARN
jgi:hypothetical protein